MPLLHMLGLGSALAAAWDLGAYFVLVINGVTHVRSRDVRDCMSNKLVGKNVSGTIFQRGAGHVFQRCVRIP